MIVSDSKVHAQPKPLVPLLPYQRRDVECDARFRWCCWSRQTGKSFTKSLRRILRGLKRGRNQIFLSAGERQSRELMMKARLHCQALKIACDYHDTDYFEGTAFKILEITLPRGVRIIGLPANPHTARGFTGDVFLDEFAMHKDDREIWAAIFPSLLRGNGELDVASTPKGRKNKFYELRDNERFSRSTVTLPDAIAQGLDIDLQELRQAMNDEQLFRQEFLCEFLDESTAFLSYDAIAACEDPRLRTDVPLDELRDYSGDLYLGIDVARRRDLTVFWLLSLEPGASATQRLISNPKFEISDLKSQFSTSSIDNRKSKIDNSLVTRAVYTLSNAPFREQQSLLDAFLSIPNVRRCCIDAGGLGMQLAEAAVERFGAHRVEPITFTAAVKSQLAGALRVAVENAAIRIPVDDAIRNDWHSVERGVTAGGHIRFEATRREGSHADRFWAAALALHAAGQGHTPFQAEMIRPLAFARTGGW